MENTEKILARLKCLKERPKMIIPISSIDYLALKIYIIGYIDGISLALGKELVKDITVWFNKKINQQYSISWIDIVPSYYKGKSDEELKDLLLDITAQYFLENPDWHQSE